MRTKYKSQPKVNVHTKNIRLNQKLLANVDFVEARRRVKHEKAPVINASNCV